MSPQLDENMVARPEPLPSFTRRQNIHMVAFFAGLTHLCDTVGQNAADHGPEGAPNKRHPRHEQLQVRGRHADVVPRGAGERVAGAIDAPRVGLVANLS